MKLVGKDTTLAVVYDWELDEIKDEKQLFKLIAKVTEIGELRVIEFHGYEDMDEHGNWAIFRSVGEMQRGIKGLSKIKPDDVTIRIGFGGEQVLVSIYGIDKVEEGVQMGFVAAKEVNAAKVAKKLEKCVEEVV